MNVIVKFREAASGIGYWNAVLLALSRLADALCGGRVRIVKYNITVQPVVAPPGGAARAGKFELSWGEAGSPLLAQADRPAEVIRARFAQGARCLVAANDGRLAGFLWFVVGPYDEDEVRVRFVPDPHGRAAWDFDVMVKPEYRMGRLFSYLWAGAGAELRARGVEHTISRISAFNAESLAAHRRLGARIVGSAFFLCAGSWQLMRTSFAPRWHFSSRREGRPVVTIATGIDG
ncbi:MAG: GNAT family N-acetyltransferase [Burkholderiales bacterium]|nr:GNAT family N-acetyltransferase [Burkholderiales bacterium]